LQEPPDSYWNGDDSDNPRHWSLKKLDRVSNFILLVIARRRSTARVFCYGDRSLSRRFRGLRWTVSEREFPERVYHSKPAGFAALVLYGF
jgi:hypothetical protein